MSRLWNRQQSKTREWGMSMCDSWLLVRSQVVQNIAVRIFNHKNQMLCREVQLLGEASRLERHLEGTAD